MEEPSKEERMEDPGEDEMPSLDYGVPAPMKFLILPASCTHSGLKDLFTDATSDVYFVSETAKSDGKHTSNERVLRLHRSILAVNSSVFVTMFQGEWKEKKSKSIPIQEVNWDAFSIALKLLYGIEARIEPETLFELYKVANLYDLACVKSSVAACVPQMDLEDVIALSSLNSELEGHPLEKSVVCQAAIQFLIQNCGKILACDDNTCGRLPYEVMVKLVSSNKVNVSEIDLYRIVRKWAERNLDLAYKKMEEIFSYIRYNNISYHDLITEVSSGVCSRVKYSQALKHHQRLTTWAFASHLDMFSPREFQKQVLQVYPMSPGIGVVADSDKTMFTCVKTRDALCVPYFGKESRCLEVLTEPGVSLEGCIMFFSLTSLPSNEGGYGLFKANIIDNTQIGLSQCYIAHGTNTMVSVFYTRFLMTLSAAGLHVLCTAKPVKRNYKHCQIEYYQEAGGSIMHELTLKLSWYNSDRPCLVTFGVTTKNNPSVNLTCQIPNWTYGSTAVASNCEERTIGNS
jgi:hypothetical protein